ncbi:calcium binding protein CalD [Nonomuraea antimicrobica]|uniref:Calcium binding protein CalD n=1 Tax=Nonomuraea antimicrobica TaxID=561173 RepID=A0ABP7B753_9ACTN
MATDLQVLKIDRSFDHIDVDGNGVITRDDLQGLGARLLVGFGASPAGAQGRRVADSFDDLWETLAAAVDLDRDGSITPDEYRTSVIASFIDGDRFEPVFRPAIEAVLALADTDGDGLIQPQELQLVHEAFGRSGQDTEHAFAALDHDADGALNRDELLYAVRDYYTSADPGAVGNLFFGRLSAA